MLIFGHPYIETQKFYRVSSIEDIGKTSPNSVIYLESLDNNLDIIKFGIQNRVDIAVQVCSIREAILCENLRVKYIISELYTSSKIQRVVDDYLFDVKNLTVIRKEEEIEKVSKYKIDGVIFEEFIQYL